VWPVDDSRAVHLYNFELVHPAANDVKNEFDGDAVGVIPDSNHWHSPLYRRGRFGAKLEFDATEVVSVFLDGPNTRALDLASQPVSSREWKGEHSVKNGAFF